MYLLLRNYLVSKDRSGQGLVSLGTVQSHSNKFASFISRTRMGESQERPCLQSTRTSISFFYLFLLHAHSLSYILHKCQLTRTRGIIHRSTFMVHGSQKDTASEILLRLCPLTLNFLLRSATYRTHVIGSVGERASTGEETVNVAQAV
ncbi:hypothetical protein KQX54_012561 [Cotesia glomerata]|uniref:Uncharacterized protein n=1 Tax=Cotesia glomerata TaxID=32391 RepID=A0AAV7IU93_COTGL|nr:hypothetical protein KQX54_012561 [Cotesia glomerata]